MRTITAAQVAEVTERSSSTQCPQPGSWPRKLLTPSKRPWWNGSLLHRFLPHKISDNPLCPGLLAGLSRALNSHPSCCFPGARIIGKHCHACLWCALWKGVSLSAYYSLQVWVVQPSSCLSAMGSSHWRKGREVEHSIIHTLSSSWYVLLIN